MATLFRRPDTGKFYIQFSIGKKQHKRAVGSDRFEAELLLKEVEVALGRGDLAQLDELLDRHNIKTTGSTARVPDQAKIGSVTLGTFLDRYLAWSKRTLATTTYRDDHSQRLPRFVNFIGQGRAIDSISSEEIERYKASRLESSQPSTVWGDLKTVGAFLQKAVEWGYASSNPTKGVRKPKVPKSTPRFLTKPEIERLLEAAKNTKLYAVLALGVYAGLRKDEIIWLEWNDIEFDREVLQITPKQGWHTKNYRPRTIPLHSRLAEILLELPRLSRWVVPNPDGTQYKNNLLRDVKKVAKIAKVPKCGLHMLRHTFASQLVMSGVSIYKVSQWLGHADVKTTMIYAHLAERDPDIERL